MGLGARGRGAVAAMALQLACWVPCEVPAASVPPDYAAVRDTWRPSDFRLLAADGTLLQRVRVDFSARRGDWVTLDQVSAALQQAVVRSEDRRFFEHGGVDWWASASAAWSALVGEGRRGASTLSMQLAAMLEPHLRRGVDGRSVLQKFDQMQAALALERHWSKSQVLEAYLNEAAFRGELVGVDALSRVMFRKTAAGLTFRESALAAVLLRGPNASTVTLVRRSCSLLRELGRPADCAGLRDFVQQSLARTRDDRFGAPRWAPHWAHFLLEQGVQPTDGVWRSTLMGGLQKATVQSVRNHLIDLRGTGVTDAAVVVLDNRSGAVLAYVGSSADLSAAPAVDHARALRQAGSTLKPFLYGMALDEVQLTAASLLDDRPLDLEGGGGLYVPDNYDHEFSGWVSVRTALASSLNVPAVRTLQLVGPDAFAGRLATLGLPLRHGGDYYGYSLALGSADVTLLSLTNAYRTLARSGRFAPVNWRAQPGAPLQAGEPLYSGAAAWIVGDILGDREARVRTFGLDGPLSTPFWSAVKTGTSRDMRDNWCIGWSSLYTVGVWVGNSEGASMRHVSGVSGAGPIWRDVLAWLHRDHPGVQAGRPASVVAHPVRFVPALEPARLEYFLIDTAQGIFTAPPQSTPAGAIHTAPGTALEALPAPAAARPRIARPVDGTVVALDPDIPWDRQRLLLRAVDVLSRPAVGAVWFLDRAPLGQFAESSWRPRPGVHVFELRAADGTVLDRSTIRVHALPRSHL